MWLEVLTGEDAGRVLEVDRPLVLGRIKGADLILRDPRASGRHAELAPVGDGLRLRDLGSANGTLVNGEHTRRAGAARRRGDPHRLAADRGADRGARDRRHAGRRAGAPGVAAAGPEPVLVDDRPSRRHARAPRPAAHLRGAGDRGSRRGCRRRARADRRRRAGAGRDRRAQRRPGHVPGRGARDRRAERPGQRLGARPRRGPARDGGARGQQRPAVLRPHGGGRGRGPGRRRRALRGPCRAARARAARGPGARRSATPTRARPCSRSASRRAPSRTSRRPPTAASSPPRTRSSPIPAPMCPRTRTRSAPTPRWTPGSRAGRSWISTAASSRSTRPRARSVKTTARCRAPTMR